MNIVSSIASIAIKNAALYRKVAGRENLLSSMSEFIPNVIFIKHRKDDSFSFVSENTMRVLGLPGEYFDSHKVDEVLLECLGEELTNELNENLVAKADSSFICDTPFTRPDDGNVINIRCAFSPIVLNGKVTHYVCVINDITSDVQAQAMLKTSVELAQNSNKAKSVFMSHMSHEIRTPMNSIAGLTYLARELPVVEENEELRSYLDQIDQSSQYLISILNNIMDMSKIESNKYELHNAEFDIGEVINEVYTVYSSQMSANGIDFELDNSGLVKTRVIGDEISLRKILNNLLSNAFKFTPSGGKVTLTVSQKLKTEKTSAVSIVVRDTGIGMSPEFIEKLFEPYTQERTENASRSAGSGLGMAICKSMIEMQGGTISAESRVGEGSCFTALLPYTLANIAVEEKKPAAADSSRLSGKRIMVVDDVAINTVITKRLLEKQKVLVECAENGQLAFDLYMSKPDYYYDCILMDIQMPVMDGMEAASRIRASGKNCAGSLPIAAMTADNFVSDNHYGDLDAFNDFILKPISPEML